MINTGSILEWVRQECEREIKMHEDKLGAMDLFGLLDEQNKIIQGVYDSLTDNEYARLMEETAMENERKVAEEEARYSAEDKIRLWEMI